VLCLAAIAAVCIDSASSVTTPLSLNALTASRVEIAASRIAFAAFLTALAVSSAWLFDWELDVGLDEPVDLELRILLIGVITPQIYLSILALVHLHEKDIHIQRHLLLLFQCVGVVK
jgi:hypothetical protein